MLLLFLQNYKTLQIIYASDTSQLFRVIINNKDCLYNGFLKIKTNVTESNISIII